jgi:hypothetical protein
VLIEDLQQGSRTQAGLATEAAEPGDAGRPRAEEDGEEAAGDRQADAFGLGGAGELGLQVGGEDQAVALGGLEATELNIFRAWFERGRN